MGVKSSDSYRSNAELDIPILGGVAPWHLRASPSQLVNGALQVLVGMLYS
jgi:hypothetical protein